MLWLTGMFGDRDRGRDCERCCCGQTATQKIQESAGKLTETELDVVQGRADVIACTTAAEMSHFQDNRIGDFKGLMQNYLRAQIDYYQQVGGGGGGDEEWGGGGEGGWGGGRCGGAGWSWGALLHLLFLCPVRK